MAEQAIRGSISIYVLDAIYYKIKEEGRYITKAVYTIIGIDLEGKKMYWDYTYLKQKGPTSGYRS